MARAALRARPATRTPRTPQPVTVLSRGNTLLANGFSANSSTVIFVEHLIFNPQDNLYYLSYADAVHFGLARSSSPDGPWTDLGYPTGLPTSSTIQQHRLILGPDNKWSWYAIQANVPTLYQTAAGAAINSTYTQTGGSLLSLGTAGAWDAGRISEIDVFQDQSGTWRMFFMAMDSPNTGEQVGMATSSGDHTGPWTKYASNPVLAKGSAGAYDGNGCADPIVLYRSGVYYLFHAYVPDQTFAGGAISGAAICGTALATTTDFVTFTKRGIVLPTGLWGASDSGHALGGDFWWPGRVAGSAADLQRALPTSASVLYRPYFARPHTQGNAGIVTWAQLMKVDPQSIFSGTALAGTPWTRVEAEGGGIHITESGTWATDSTTSTSKRGTSGNALRWSQTTNSFQRFTWTGSRARVWLLETKPMGIANILLDGVLVATYDGCGTLAETVAGVVIGYDTGDLSPGTHTVQVTVTGTKNANATGTFVEIDCWEYM